MAERSVRFTDQFFDRLDELLPTDRGGDGAPSVTDFLAFEAPRIRDRLAQDFDDITIATDDPDVRVYLTAGLFFGHIAVYVLDRPSDQAVDVFWLTLDAD